MRFAVAFGATKNVFTNGVLTKNQETIFLEIMGAENVDEAIGKAFRKCHNGDYSIGAFRAVSIEEPNQELLRKD